MEIDYDFAVIGGGSAGYAAARTAVDHGLKTAVIDNSETLGGLCILRGCMPSKTLIESANRNLTLRRADEFGLRARDLEVMPKEIRERKRALIGDFAGYRQEQLESGRFDLHRGTAEYVDATTLRFTPKDGGDPFEIAAETSLIATGSTILVPPVDGLKDSGYLTSDDILDADSIPESVIVLGGGAIALEMAHYLDGVGSKVTVVQRSPQVLKDMDEDVARAVEKALRERGIRLYTGTKLTNVSSSDGKKVVTFSQEGSDIEVEGTEILCALGRTPATEGLGLDNVSIEFSGRQIQTDLHQATSSPNIFAAGDVCGPHEIVHLAIEQGEAAATNAAVHLGRLPESAKRTMDYRLKLFGVFTHPQAALVGMTEKEATAAGIDFAAAKYPFDDHGKSMVMGETEGFVKLIADRKSGEIIGGAVVGPEGVELIHEITVAMHFRSTAATLLGIPHYHPTLSEIWTYPAEEITELLAI